LTALMIVGACADGGAQAPAPSPVPPTPTVAPSPTKVRPTATPTVAPSPTPVPATASDDARGLLRKLEGSQQTIKSGRGLMMVEVEAEQEGTKESVAMRFEFETADPDSRMMMSGVGPLMPFEMEIISKDDTTYFRMDDEWTAMPGGGQSEFSTGGSGPMEMGELEALLGDASSATVVERRVVRGVECDVVSFTLGPDSLRELAAQGIGGEEEGPLADEDVQIDEFKGEVAIGVADQLLREMTMQFSGHSKATPADRFRMMYTIAMWDINSPDVVITVPPEAQAAGALMLTPTR
jgi:hypothetical protein